MKRDNGGRTTTVEGHEAVHAVTSAVCMEDLLVIREWHRLFATTTKLASVKRRPWTWLRRVSVFATT